MGEKYSVDVKKVREIQGTINDAIFAGNPDALVGHYAGIVPFEGKKLAMHTDGVGTKVLVADELEKYDTVGIDAIAMNVNDIICIGAKPLAGVDYLAVAQEDEYLIAEIMKGLVVGARESEISIVGGETAIMKDVIHGVKRPFDLAFTVLGVVEKYITGAESKVGDVLISLGSSGLHSNGYTLARKVLAVDKWGEKMLAPTLIYVKAVLEMIRNSEVHGLAHITGGAFSKLTRLNKEVGFSITDPVKPAEIFEELWKSVEDEQHMYRTFNMGTGMVVVAPESEAENIISIAKKHSVDAQVIGKVTPEKGVYLKEKIRLDYQL